MNITDEMIEAVANQLRSQFNDFDSSIPLMRKRAKMLLRVAAPRVEAQALSDAADQMQKDDPAHHVAWLRTRAKAVRGEV